MTDKGEPNFLGKLASVVVLLAAALYFTGWTYRWAYFSFFKLEITSLNLPLESFYIAAFQALFGHPLAGLRTVVTFILTAIAILFTLQLSRKFLVKILRQIPIHFSSTQFDSIRFLRSLTDEIVIVLWTLGGLFFLSQWQADADAWLDAVNETSTLPTVTFLTPENNAALGRKLDDPFSSPSQFRIIGDRDRYQNLLTQDFTDTRDPNKQRVWRLLFDGDGYVCIFPALPSSIAQGDRTLRPPVLVIYESGNGDQMMIISPKAYQDN